jgi:hypothetical protein
LVVRTARLLAASCVALCAAAAPAAGTINVSSFTLTPSSKVAGGNPALSSHVGLSPSPDGDDVRNLTVSLAPGLLANPGVVPERCSQAQLAGDSCPAGSQVGTGLVDANVEFFGDFVDVPAKLHLMEPGPGEVARAGLVANAFGAKFFVSGPIRLRTSPAAGLDLSFTEIARTIGEGPFAPRVELREVDLTINGSVAGKAFTRNPTACGTATTRLTATSYAGDSESLQSAFTPTGCSSLAFAPQLSGSVTAGPGLSLGVRTIITQAAGEAALRRAELTLPPFISPRLTALARACGASDPSACPSSATVGSTTVTSPLLSAPLKGRIVLRKGSPLPGLALVFPPPFPLEFEGSTTLTPLGLRSTFDNLPDLPISKLEVDFSSGSQSLLTRAGVCLTGGTLRGSFTGRNGKTTSDSSRLAVLGCPFPKPAATVSLRGLAGNLPVLKLLVRAPDEATAAAAVAARAIEIDHVSLKLPKGLKLNKRKLAKRIALKLDGKRGGASAKASSKRLRLKLGREGVQRVVVKVKGRALRVSRALRRKVQGSKAKRLKFTVKVRYAGDGVFTLRPKARPR